MYTTTSNVDSIIKAYSMGANLFMIKSFSYSKLVIYLTTLFEYKWNEPGINSKYYFREGNLVPI
jgi:DNA-binding NtrC family response regulator